MVTEEWTTGRRRRTLDPFSRNLNYGRPVLLKTLASAALSAIGQGFRKETSPYRGCSSVGFRNTILTAGSPSTMKLRASLLAR